METKQNKCIYVRDRQATRKHKDGEHCESDYTPST